MAEQGREGCSHLQACLHFPSGYLQLRVLSKTLRKEKRSWRGYSFSSRVSGAYARLLQASGA